MTALTVTGKWSTKRQSVDIDHVFLEDLVGIPDGTEVCAVISTDRNPDGLKAYWALLGSIIRSGAARGFADKHALDDHIRQGIHFGKWRVVASETDINAKGLAAALKACRVKRASFLRRLILKALRAYLGTAPARAVFIPDSIALSKCDGRKFTDFMRRTEELLARMGINIDDHRRDAAEQQRRAA